VAEPLPLEMEIDAGSQESVSDLEGQSDGQSDLESGHADFSDSEDDISQGVESYHEEIADADKWVPGSGSNTEVEVDTDDAVNDVAGENMGNEQPAPPSPAYNLRPRQERNYEHRFGFLTVGGDDESQRPGVSSMSAGVASGTLTYGYAQALHEIRRREVWFHYTNHLQAEELLEDDGLDSVMPRVAH